MDLHGIVLKGLKDFVTEEYDAETWYATQSEAGLDGKTYVPLMEYDDADLHELVAAASEVTGEGEPELLDAFGRFLVPSLVETYGVHVDEDWTGLELVANVETHVLDALGDEQSTADAAPDLSAEWVADDRVRVTYASERELCGLAKGLLRGVADYYGEEFEVEEETCTSDGSDRCEILVGTPPDA